MFLNIPLQSNLLNGWVVLPSVAVPDYQDNSKSLNVKVFSNFLLL